MARIVDAVTAGPAQPNIDAARAAAWDAARAAAWDAARDAAWDAARAAARAAARDAAWAAAWDAALDAARAAAWAAASQKLAPVVAELQTSFVALLTAMCAVGRGEVSK